MDHRTAKWFFNFRIPILAVFAIGVFWLVAFNGDALADAIAFFVLLTLYVFLTVRAVQFRCPHCEKSISSSRPWVCKVCNQPNHDTNVYSFLNKCGVSQCGVEPSAYRCHHCKDVIYFTNDEDNSSCATSWSAVAERPEPTERQKRREIDEDQAEDLKHQINIEELNEKLRNIRLRSKVPKMKSPLEQREERADQKYAATMGMREYRKRKRAEAEEEYGDDPESLQKAYEAIDDAIGDDLT